MSVLLQFETDIPIMLLLLNALVHVFFNNIAGSFCTYLGLRYFAASQSLKSGTRDRFSLIHSYIYSSQVILCQSGTRLKVMA